MATQTTYPLLTLRGVAEQLDVSTRSVRRWIASGDLPAFRVGHQWRIHPDDLDRFLWQCRRTGPEKGVR